MKKELIKLVLELERKLEVYFITVKFFTDNSGELVCDHPDIIIDFDNLNELKRKIKEKL